MVTFRTMVGFSLIITAILAVIVLTDVASGYVLVPGCVVLAATGLTILVKED